MTKLAPLGALTATAALFAGSVQADVTAADVWADWQNYLAGMGYVIDATESQTGNGLEISDLTLAMTMPEDEGTANVSIGTVTLTNTGDGAVDVELPATIPMTMNMTPKLGSPVSMAMTFTSDGFGMTVTGDPDNMVYDYSADAVGMSVDQIDAEDELEINALNMTATNVTGRSTMVVADMRRSDQTMAAETATYLFDFTDPETGGAVSIQGRINDLATSGQMTMPTEFDAQDMMAMLSAGFGFDGDITTGGGTSTFNFAEDGETMIGTTQSSASQLRFAMDSTALDYTGSSSDMVMNLQGAGIPFPIDMEMAKADFGMMVPLGAGDAPQDFAVSFTMGDFVMSDMIWGLFDPTGQLPRDPATITLDLGGTAVLDHSILDQKAMENLGGQAPGELRSMGLNDLTLRVAGAELTGTGDVAFDNSDTTSFDGLPAPVGSVDLKLTGGNTLLDTLVGMGLVPEEQAMGARMMMGLFAVAGAGEDTLTSKIEFTENRQILANGQRLK